MIAFLVAKPCDSIEIANLHYICALKRPDGFMHKLGISFLRQYYKIFLNEKNSLTIIAEKDNKIVGFHSGTMDAEEHHLTLRKNKVSLGLSILPIIFTNPSILFDVVKRFKSLGNKENDFRVKSGPRGEYWGWNPNFPDSTNSLKLHKLWHTILKELGATYVRSEVDLTNDRIVKSIKLMGGIFLEEVVLDDGRKRAIVEYKL